MSKSLPAWLIDSVGGVWLITQTTASDEKYHRLGTGNDPHAADPGTIGRLYGPIRSVGPGVVLVNPR